MRATAATDVVIVGADDDILASKGHIAPLAGTISRRSGEPEAEVRAALDEMLLAAT